jgi:hypothetical protein
MFDWMSPAAFFQTMARVALVWLAFYGAGKLLRKPLRVDSAFPLLPSEILGMLAFVVFTIPLSIIGILNRSVCPLFLVLLAIPGVLFVYGTLRDGFSWKRPGILQILLGLFFSFVVLLNFTHASMPELYFDDPLITYAFQPDRWLNEGKVFWLNETTFSAFPLLYEMTAVWPASLSTDRMNQLSILQVFQMSLLVVAVFRGLSVLNIRKSLWLGVSSVVLTSTAMYTWCSLAKTDTMAMLFCTLALASALRQKEKDYSLPTLSSWLFMGLAIASKQTAAVILVPFFIYSVRDFLRYSARFKVLALVSLIAIPGAYAVRTMLTTGSPTYPVYPVTSLLNSGWELEYPEEQMLVNNRSSQVHESRNFSFSKHIGVFFAFMEGNFLLLLAGIICAFFAGKCKDALTTIPLFIYLAFAIALFWPPWWGYKYSILAYPFAAILGVKLLDNMVLALTLVIIILALSFIVPGFIVAAGEVRPFTYRIAVAESVLSGNWQVESGYGIFGSSPEGMTNMWVNSYSSRNSVAVIFSIHEEKRYFFDGTVIVGWRHPLGQQLYLENTLEQELSILDSLKVDFVGFYRNQPSILGQEDRLAILDHIGIGDILEPIIIVNGNYLICKYNNYAHPAELTSRLVSH